MALQHSMIKMRPLGWPRWIGWPVHKIPVFFLIFFLVAAGLSGVSVASAASLPVADQVKAAYIYKILKYITWPEIPKSEPLVIGVWGQSQVQDALEAFKVQSGGPQVSVINRTSASKATSVDVLFLSGDEEDQVKSILDSLKGKNVITFGETEEFLSQGGMINFLIDDGRVRFDVNLPAIKAGGFNISSHALRVAREIRK